MENNGGAHSKGEFTWDPISIAMPLWTFWSCRQRWWMWCGVIRKAKKEWHHWWGSTSSSVHGALHDSCSAVAIAMYRWMGADRSVWQENTSGS
jgi:IS1 family transposase